MQQRLSRIFSIGFSAVWGWILLNSVIRWPHNGIAAALVATVFALAAVCVVRFGILRADGMGAKPFKTLLALLLVLYGAALLAMGFLLAEVPIMDMEVVLKSIPDFLDDGIPQIWGGYYVVCNNNLGLALLLSVWYWIVGHFGIAPTGEPAIYAGIVLNVFAIWISVVLLCLLARRILHTNSGVLTAFCMSAAFLPFVLWSPCFYSDTLSLPFALAALLCWERFRDQTKRRNKLLWLAAMGAVLFVGYGIKGSVGVMLVAVVIQLFLEKKARQAVAAGAVVVAVFGVLNWGYTGWQHSGFLDFSVQETDGFPIELWFAYGSTGDGDYSDPICQAAKDLPTYEQRRQMLRQTILQNYKAYSPVGLVDFMSRKAAITWGDGVYDAQEFLATPLKANWTHRFILEGQPGYMPMVYYCQVYQFFLMGLVLSGGVWAALRPRVDTLTLARISVFGLILFLSLWETKARYSFNFTPLLLLLASAELWRIACGWNPLKMLRPEKKQ